jgi:hypothetical protein
MVLTPLCPFELALDREASDSHAPNPMVQEVQPSRLSEEPATPVYVPATPTTPMFVPVQAPSSTPPRKPTNRRKTLAGVTGFTGIPVQRSSPRLRAKKRSMPIAQLAEKVLYHRLGIVKEGEEVTEVAIKKFVTMFEGKLPDIAIAALRALFRMDCDFAAAVEEALVEHGGADAVDLTRGDAAATPAAA